VLAAQLQLLAETIGSRFGGTPQSLPAFALPVLGRASAKRPLIPTITIALLGAIESLLRARVADNATESPRHDPNQALTAQGVANFIAHFFGGIPATGTIAHTVTNVPAGAAAPRAVHVPLAAPAGIVMFAALNMGEWHEFARLRKFSLQYRTILVGTFLPMVVLDRTVAVEFGLILAYVFFIDGMSMWFSVRPHVAGELPPGVRVFELFGSLFVGAAGKLDVLIGAEAIVPNVAEPVGQFT